MVLRVSKSYKYKRNNVIGSRNTHLKQKEVKALVEKHIHQGHQLMPAHKYIINPAKYKKKTHLQDILSINFHKHRENDFGAQGFFLGIFFTGCGTKGKNCGRIGVVRGWLSIRHLVSCLRQSGGDEEESYTRRTEAQRSDDCESG